MANAKDNYISSQTLNLAPFISNMGYSCMCSKHNEVIPVHKNSKAKDFFSIEAIHCWVAVPQ